MEVLMNMTYRSMVPGAKSIFHKDILNIIHCFEKGGIVNIRHNHRGPVPCIIKANAVAILSANGSAAFHEPLILGVYK